MVHPLGDVEQAVGGVPRQVLVALAVGIDREQVPVLVEVEVVGVAEAVGEDFGLLAVGREADDRAAVAVF